MSEGIFAASVAARTAFDLFTFDGYRLWEQYDRRRRRGDGMDATTAGRVVDVVSPAPQRSRPRRVVVCNCASYCYFMLAIVLFSLGTVLTILVLDDSDKVFPNLTHMWLIGPIFISSGLMFAIKTIMYLRRETMLAYLTRQHSLLRELHIVAMEPAFLTGVGRNMSTGSLPPPYDAVVHESPSCQRPLLSLAEQSPPTYEEAVLLRAAQTSLAPASSTELVPLCDTSKDSDTGSSPDR